MSTRIKAKPGRRPLPENLKRKCINCMLNPVIVQRLEDDVLEGKAETTNQMMAQIIENYYKEIDIKNK